MPLRSGGEGGRGSEEWIPWRYLSLESGERFEWKQNVTCEGLNWGSQSGNECKHCWTACSPEAARPASDRDGVSGRC